MILLLPVFRRMNLPGTHMRVMHIVARHCSSSIEDPIAFILYMLYMVSGGITLICQKHGRRNPLSQRCCSYHPIINTNVNLEWNRVMPEYQSKLGNYIHLYRSSRLVCGVPTSSCCNMFRKMFIKMLHLSSISNISVNIKGNRVKNRDNRDSNKSI